MKGFLNCVVVLFLCLALVAAMSCFLFLQTDLSQAVFSGPSVEKVKWYGDMLDYSCRKNQSLSVNIEREILQNLGPATYSRSGNDLILNDTSSELIGVHIVYKGSSPISNCL